MKIKKMFIAGLGLVAATMSLASCSAFDKIANDDGGQTIIAPTESQPDIVVTEYTITINYINGDKRTVKVKSDDTFDLDAYKKNYSNYRFDGWYLDYNFTTKVTSNTEFNKDLSVYAKYTLIENEVSTEVESVIAMIKALPEVNSVTLNDKTAIESAETEYNKLSSADKAKVSNYNKLSAVRSQYNLLLEAEQNKQLTLSLVVNGEVHSHTFDNGTTINLDTLLSAITLPENKEFDGYYSDSGYTTQVLSSVTLNDNTLVYVKLKDKISYYTLSIYVQGQTLPQTMENIASGRTVDLSGVALSITNFAGFYDNAEFTGDPIGTSVVVNGNTTIYAKVVEPEQPPVVVPKTQYDLVITWENIVYNYKIEEGMTIYDWTLSDLNTGHFAILYDDLGSSYSKGTLVKLDTEKCAFDYTYSNSTASGNSSITVTRLANASSDYFYVDVDGNPDHLLKVDYVEYTDWITYILKTGNSVSNSFTLDANGYVKYNDKFVLLNGSKIRGNAVLGDEYRHNGASAVVLTLAD